LRVRLASRLRRAFGTLRWRELALARERCALCGFPLLARIADHEIGVRCPRCGASAITQSLVDVLARQAVRLEVCDVYEMSAQGPLVAWLGARAKSLVTSEYLDGVAPGARHDGVLCQDVQRLTFCDGSFDVCTSTEVFEHVEDDRRGFREVLRVLRPGGLLVFSVPMDASGLTVERTRLEADGRRIDVLPPEYHGDRLRGDKVFTYRNYGRDVCERLVEAGFAQASIERPRARLFGHARPIVVARK
jgi:SAM-dependent methyltransferase